MSIHPHDDYEEPEALTMDHNELILYCLELYDTIRYGKRRYRKLAARELVKTVELLSNGLDLSSQKLEASERTVANLLSAMEDKEVHTWTPGPKHDTPWTWKAAEPPFTSNPPPLNEAPPVPPSNLRPGNADKAPRCEPFTETNSG